MEWLLVPDRLVWVFHKLLIYWDFHAQPSLGFTENGPKNIKYPVSGSCVDENALLLSEVRRMGRLVRDDRKATVTQITTHYNQGMQNTISERTTRRTLKQMGYSSRRPHRVPLLSAKNKKWRLQFTQAHQNWTIEEWKYITWSDESRFLLRHSDGRVRIWHKEHESMDPPCLVSKVLVLYLYCCIVLYCCKVQAAGGGVMVWGKFLDTLGPLVPIEHRLNATAYWSIVADMSIPLWLQYTHLLMATSSRIMHHVTKLKSSQTGFLNMTMSSLYSNGLHSHQTNLQQLCDVIMSIWTKISEECLQHLVESMPRRIKAVLKAKGGPTRY